MKTRNLHIIILLLITAFLFSSFSKNINRIFWSSERQLSWLDYQAHPDYSDQFRDAVTASAINFKTRCHPNNSMEVFISAQFLKDKSWVKPEALTNYHLGHEQLHFDITELYVRKFRQVIEDLEFSCGDLNSVQTISNQIMQECQEMQLQYDRDTKYSLHQSKQVEWEAKIKTELSELAHLEDNTEYGSIQ